MEQIMWRLTSTQPYTYRCVWADKLGLKLLKYGYHLILPLSRISHVW